MEDRLSRQKITADVIATFLSCVISLRLVDRLEMMSLLANAAAGTAAAQLLKRIAPGGEAWDVLVQCGLIYANKEAGPLMSAITSVWSAPIAFVSRTLSSTLLDHALLHEGEHHVYPSKVPDFPNVDAADVPIVDAADQQEGPSTVTGMGDGATFRDPLSPSGPSEEH